MKRILVGVAICLPIAAVILWFFFSYIPNKSAKENRYSTLLEKAGDVIEVKKDFSEGSAILREAIAIFPDRSGAVVDLAMCKIRMKKYQDAIESLETVIDADEDISVTDRANYLVGEAYLGRYRDTRSDRDFRLSQVRLERLVDSETQGNRALVSLGSLLLLNESEGSREKALKYLDLLSKRAPNSEEYRQIKNLHESLKG